MPNRTSTVFKLISLQFMLLFAGTCQAISLSDLPFISNQPESNISIADNGNKKLQKVLEAELKIQREQNQQLKLYKAPSKIAFYERQLLTKRLRAEGYYASSISSISTAEKITHQVKPGPLYVIDDVTLNFPAQVDFPDAIKPAQGAPLIAQNILNSRSELESFTAKNYCFYKVNVDYKVDIDHDQNSANVAYTLRDTTSTTFGEITLQGADTIDKDYLLNKIKLKSGSCFRRAELDSARLTLLKTNLLGAVTIEEGAKTDAGVPIQLTVKERKHRSISYGVGYRAEEGVGVLTGWEHRNLWGRAELANVDLYIAQKRQALNAKLTIPDFYRDDQTLTLFSDLEKEETDAYDSKIASLGALVSRNFGRHLRADIGAQIDFSRILEDDQLEDYALLSFPMKLEYDRRSAPLDPRTGWIIGLGAQPFWDMYETSTTFLKNSIAASVYHTFNHLPMTPTLAVRAAVGSISGASSEAIPVNERFYVGGGGSVRGYPYQTLGPMTDDEPDGGLSFNEISIETRLHFGESWGAALFVDGGYAYAEEVPTVGEDILWGAGIGLRYYTSFAPIRFDVAFPLDKRDEIDDAFQIYISLGQAF